MTLRTLLSKLGSPLVWSRPRPPAEDEALGLVDAIEVYEDPTSGTTRLGIVGAVYPDQVFGQDRDYAATVELKADGYWTATDRGVAFKLAGGDVYQFDIPVDQVDDMAKVKKWQNYRKTLAGVFQVDDAKKVFPKGRTTVASS